MLALSAFGLLPAGCLVAEAPDYGPARQTAPVVDPNKINPIPLYQFEVDFVTPTPVSLLVKSEDAGEKLTVAIYVDYRAPDLAGPIDAAPIPRERFMGDFDVAPRPSDQPKSVNFTFDPNRTEVSPGCHTLTVLLMHESSFDSFENKPIKDREATDLTMVTWFFFAKDVTDLGASVPCPGGPDPTKVAQ